MGKGERLYLEISDINIFLILKARVVLRVGSTPIEGTPDSHAVTSYPDDWSTWRLLGEVYTDSLFLDKLKDGVKKLINTAADVAIEAIGAAREALDDAIRALQHARADLDK